MYDLKKIVNEINPGVEFISLREVGRSSKIHFVRNEVIEGVTRHFDHGIMIEVFINGQFGYAATDDLTLSSLKKTAMKAKELAQIASQKSLYHFTLDHRPVVKGDYTSPHEIGLEQYRVQEYHDLLVHASRQMAINDKIISRSTGIVVNEMETHLVSNLGHDVHQKIMRVTLGASCIANDSTGSQTRSFGWDVNEQTGLEKLKRDKYLMSVQKIAEEANELLTAEECPTGAMDLLLDPDQMYLQIHESIGHPLELDRILGDERNYAGWSFVKPHDFGNLQYGSPIMNVTFDPTVHGQNASYAFDDIGAKATREFIIQDGKLKRGLGSLESQARLAIPGVSSQRATSWNRPPIDRMANLNLEPGDSSLEQMISSIENGVWMKSNKSWSIDDYRNKFQFGCEYGKLIKDGKVVKTIKNPNYRGITVPFWNSLKMVGDESTFVVGGLGSCGKGEPNQIMFVGHASPVCLFSNVEVFGGGR